MKLQQSILFLSILLLPALCYNMNCEPQEIILFSTPDEQLKNALDILKIESVWYSFDPKNRKSLSPKVYSEIQNSFRSTSIILEPDTSEPIQSTYYQKCIKSIQEIEEQKQAIVENKRKQQKIMDQIKKITAEIAALDKPNSKKPRKRGARKTKQRTPVILSPAATPAFKKTTPSQTPLQKKRLALKKLFAAYNVQSQKQLLAQLNDICYAIENDSHYTLSDNAKYNEDKQQLKSKIDHYSSFKYYYKTKEFKIIFNDDDSETSD